MNDVFSRNHVLLDVAHEPPNPARCRTRRSKLVPQPRSYSTYSSLQISNAGWKDGPGSADHLLALEDFAYFPGKHVHGEGLLKRGRPAFDNTVLDRGVLRIAGDEQDLH